MNKRPSILIVEDDHITAERIEDDLRSAGYNVSGTAGNLVDAMRLVKRKGPDLALIDLKLDGPEDGIVVAQEILKIKQMPIIYITGEAEAYFRAVERALVTFPVAFLEKPLRMRELLSFIRLGLAGHSTNQTLPNTSSESEYLLIPTGKAYVYMRQKEILYVQAEGQYTNIFTTESEQRRISSGKSPFLVSVNLGRIAERLNKDFYNLSRSIYINTSHLEKIEPEELTLSGKQVPIPNGRRFKIIDDLKAIKSK